MNPEMTLIDAMKKIDYLNGQMTAQAIMSAIVFIFLCCVIVFLTRRNNRLNDECRQLENRVSAADRNQNSAHSYSSQLQNELTTTISRLKAAEDTIEKLQGVKIGKEYSGPPSFTGDAGSEADIIKDSIGNFGPGGGGFRI